MLHIIRMVIVDRQTGIPGKVSAAAYLVWMRWSSHAGERVVNGDAGSIQPAFLPLWGVLLH